MEDVLDVYTRPHDPKHPVVCMDETSKQLVGETRRPVPMKPGQPGRHDYEYQRNGVCNLFMFFEPLGGWRTVKVTDRRTKVDWAWAMRELVDIHFADAEVVTVVQDNLNTHSPSSFYEAFAPPEARRILDRLELHFTPKHGSWLNMAEIELSALARQCLSRRIPDKSQLYQEIQEWERTRNALGTKADWRFTTDDARIKLRRLYPSINIE